MPFTIGGDYIKPSEPQGPLKIFIEKRRGKTVTIIKNAPGDIEALASELKKKCSCGGSVKNDQIELQGDHVQFASQWLKRAHR